MQWSSVTDHQVLWRQCIVINARS